MAANVSTSNKDFKPRSRDRTNVFLTSHGVEAFISATAESRRYTNMSCFNKLVREKFPTYNIGMTASISSQKGRPKSSQCLNRSANGAMKIQSNRLMQVLSGKPLRRMTASGFEKTPTGDVVVEYATTRNTHKRNQTFYQTDTQSFKAKRGFNSILDKRALYRIAMRKKSATKKPALSRTIDFPEPTTENALKTVLHKSTALYQYTRWKKGRKKSCAPCSFCVGVQKMPIHPGMPKPKVVALNRMGLPKQDVSTQWENQKDETTRQKGKLSIHLQEVQRLQRQRTLSIDTIVMSPVRVINLESAIK